MEGNNELGLKCNSVYTLLHLHSFNAFSDWNLTALEKNKEKWGLHPDACLEMVYLKETVHIVIIVLFVTAFFKIKLFSSQQDMKLTKADLRVCCIDYVILDLLNEQ